MSCLYLHEIFPASAFTSAFHISHGLIDSLIRYSVFKVQTAFMLRKHFVRLKQFGVGLISFAYFVTGIRPPHKRFPQAPCLLSAHSKPAVSRSGYHPNAFRPSFRHSQTSLHAVSHAKTLAMETKRFELSTPCLQGRCSPN